MTKRFQTGHRRGFKKFDLHSERLIGMRQGVPYFLKRFNPPEKETIEKDTYPLLRIRETGEIIPFKINKQKNPHALILGSTRRSGKSTFADILNRHEMYKKDAFSLMFDPKGEYPKLDYRNMDVRRVGLNDPTNPAKLKPSTLTKQSWKVLVDNFAIGRGKKAVMQGVLKAARELDKKGESLSLDNILNYIRRGNIKKIKPDSANMLSVEEFIDEIRELGWFDEDEGIDMKEEIRTNDALVLDVSAPGERVQVSIFAMNLLQQIYKLKEKAKQTGEMPDIWDRRVLVLVDEAGDPSYGLINTENQMECKRVVQRIFTKYAYANIIGLIVTQYPQNIATPVINGCQNLWVGYMAEDRALRKIASMSQYALSEVRLRVTDQQVGEFCWFRQEGIVETEVKLPPDWTPQK